MNRKLFSRKQMVTGCAEVMCGIGGHQDDVIESALNSIVIIIIVLISVSSSDLVD